MVECEYAKIFDELKAVRVLIDTWWNVNVGNVANLTIMNGVLIDTWWNVNLKSPLMQQTNSAF